MTATQQNKEFFVFFNENQNQQIASFAKKGCHLVPSSDKKDIKLRVL